MRLSNRNKSNLYHFLHAFYMALFCIGCIAFVINKFRTRYLGWESIFLILIPFLLLAVFYFRGKQIFEYDSDGEALNFKNRNVMPFLASTLSDEFPKYKLQKFEILNGLVFKRLYIYISSKKSNLLTLRYDISYLNKQELRDLRISLNKVVKQNKESGKIR